MIFSCRRQFILMTVLPFFICVLLLVSVNTPLFSGQESIEKKLRIGYLQLLIKKGICDEQEKEIEGRISELIQEAAREGLRSDNDILSFVLGQLNYSKSNLGNFPSCAFDRPIGYKMIEYGHTVAPFYIDNKAEGSACPAEDD